MNNYAKERERDFFLLYFRFVWVLILIGSIIWMSYNITSRIRNFNKNPTAIDMEINYQRHMKFPVITICNKNALRYGIYYLIKQFMRYNIIRFNKTVHEI